MSDTEDPTYNPKNRRGRKKRDEDVHLGSIRDDLLSGYRILQDIIGISKFFLDEPDPRKRGLLDYYNVIIKPMCFSEIRRKFVEEEYNNIAEFVSDVRLLLLNCYRYFGPDDIHTKRALRVEQIFEQRIASLPSELRKQCSLEAKSELHENQITEKKDEEKEKGTNDNFDETQVKEQNDDKKEKGMDGDHVEEGKEVDPVKDDLDELKKGGENDNVDEGQKQEDNPAEEGQNQGEEVNPVKDDPDEVKKKGENDNVDEGQKQEDNPAEEGQKQGEEVNPVKDDPDEVKKKGENDNVDEGQKQEDNPAGECQKQEDEKVNPVKDDLDEVKKEGENDNVDERQKREDNPAEEGQKQEQVQIEFVSKLLKSVEGEKEQRIIERRKKLLEERRAEKEGKEKPVIEWEKQELYRERNLELIKYMWELPVIGHFVALALNQLNIYQIPMYELERMFLMPQASQSLASLMTTLLSAPLPRMRIHMKPPMPYKIWTKILKDKVAGWYKLYQKKQNNPQIVFEKYGIEHQFWKILGDADPLVEHEFHELTFHQRVFLVKTVCDYCLQNHKMLRDTIAEMADGYEKCYLGADRTGARYLYFPEFLEYDVRVYKQNLDPKTWLDRDEEHMAEVEANKLKTEEDGGSSKNKRRKRKSPWQRGKIEKKIKAKQKSPLKYVISLKSQKMTASDGNGVPLESEEKDKESEKSVIPCDESQKQSEPASECDAKDTSALLASEQGDSEKNNNERVNDVGQENVECNSNERVKPLIVCREKDEYVMKTVSSMSVDDGSGQTMDDTRAKGKLYVATWLEPSLEDFTLVADSVKGLRELLDSFCDDDLELNHRLSNSKKDKNSRPHCEVLLAGRLGRLLSDVEPLELEFLNSIKTCRRKLHDEWLDFQNRPSNFVDPDEAFWLNEKDTSEAIDNDVPDVPVAVNPVEPKLEEESLSGAPAEVADYVPGGMTLRNRRIEDHLSDEILAQFNLTEESTESESDDGDNWVLPKSRKRKRSKAPKAIVQDNQPKKNATEQEEGSGRNVIQIKKRLFYNENAKEEQRTVKQDKTCVAKQVVKSKEQNASRQTQNGVIETQNGVVPTQPMKQILQVKKIDDLQKSVIAKPQESYMLVPRVNSKGETYYRYIAVGKKEEKTMTPATEVKTIATKNAPAPNPTVPTVQNIVQHLPQISVTKPVQPDEVVCISDSDSDVEFIDEVYNPKLDRKAQEAQKQPRTKCVLDKVASNPQRPVPVSMIQTSAARSFQENSQPATSQATRLPQTVIRSPSNNVTVSPTNQMRSTNVIRQVQGSSSPAVRGHSPHSSPSAPIPIIVESHTIPTIPGGQSSPTIHAAVRRSPSATHTYVPTTPRASLNNANRSNQSPLSNSPLSPPVQTTPRRRVPPIQISPSSVRPQFHTVRSPGSPAELSPSASAVRPQINSICSPGSPAVLSQSPSAVRPQFNSVRSPGSPAGLSPSASAVRPQFQSVRSPGSPAALSQSPSAVRRYVPATPTTPIANSEIRFQPSPGPIHTPRARAPQTSPRPRAPQTSPRPRAPQTSPQPSVATVQPQNQTARLVVVPGNGISGSNYALLFPNGSKVILTPNQVADMRAANGGHLATNISL